MVVYGSTADETRTIRFLSGRRAFKFLIGWRVGIVRALSDDDDDNTTIAAVPLTHTCVCVRRARVRGTVVTSVGRSWLTARPVPRASEGRGWPRRINSFLYDTRRNTVGCCSGVARARPRTGTRRSRHVRASRRRRAFAGRDGGGPLSTTVGSAADVTRNPRNRRARFPVIRIVRQKRSFSRFAHDT